MGTYARFAVDATGASAAMPAALPQGVRPLRILVHGLNFWPDLTGVAKYTFEMTEWLARRGHEVCVVTAPPHYPAWEVGAGYRSGRFARETVSGIRVLRCPLYVPKRQTVSRRVAHAFSFGASSLAATLYRGSRWRPDLVWTVAPSIIAAATALSAARLAGVPAWLHVQDLEAEAAFALGLAGGTKLRRLAVGLESRFIRRFDHVSTISGPMLRRVIEKGCEPDRVTLVPNWVDLSLIRPMARPSRFRRELGLTEEDVVALYSGNMGYKQGLPIILEAAERLSGDRRLHFVIAGEGPARPGLEAAARHLANVLFLPLQPLARLPELLSAADIHLLPQLAGAADLVLPSKLSGMMASGRPVIATAEPHTELAQQTSPNGMVTPPGDADRFSAAIAALAGDRDLRDRLGRTARERAVRQWDRDLVLSELERHFLLLAEGHARMPRRP